MREMVQVPKDELYLIWLTTACYVKHYEIECYHPRVPEALPERWRAIKAAVNTLAPMIEDHDRYYWEIQKRLAR